MNFQWCRIKLHLLPTVMQEIDIVIKEYTGKYHLLISIDLVNNILSEDNEEEAYEQMKKYEKYREDIQDRISQLEDFYELNFGEENIEHFDIARLRLKRLLMYDVVSISKINRAFTNKDEDYILSSNNNASIQSSQAIHFSNNQDTSVLQSNKNNVSTSEADKKKTIVNDAMKFMVNTDNIENPGNTVKGSFNPYNKASIQTKTTINKNTKTQSQKPVKKISNNQTNKSPKKASDLFSNPFIVSETSDWKDVTFRIMLNEKEYKALVGEKAKLIKLG